MRNRYRILERDHAHFVTATTVAWLPIFTTAARCDILVDSFEYCRQHKELKLYAWVILDTHFHAIVAAPELARVLADLKRHTARRLVEQLEAERSDWLLRQLRDERAPTKTESVHQVWQEGSHPQAIMSDEMMRKAGVPAQQPSQTWARHVTGTLAVFIRARVVTGSYGRVAMRHMEVEEAVQLPRQVRRSEVQLRNEEGGGSSRRAQSGATSRTPLTPSFPSCTWERHLVFEAELRRADS